MHLLSLGTKNMNITPIEEIKAKRRLLDLREWLDNLDDAELDLVVGECLTRRKLRGRAVKALVWKICDICMRTFPEYSLVCDKCGSSKKSLRTIERKHNYDEILDDMKI